MRREWAIQCLVALLISQYCSVAMAEVFITTVHGDPLVNHPDFLSPLSSESMEAYAVSLEKQHDLFLANLESGSYKKLYSYSHVINGFAIDISPEQAGVLSNMPGIKRVERDWKVKTMTTHTPSFLGLPQGVWPHEGGPEGAGEGVTIGIIDTGIDPTHPSFSSQIYPPYSISSKFRGICEEATKFCNNKIVGAQHFSAAAEASGAFNSSSDYASPLDGDGHGSHTASIAAGNYGIPVIVNGFFFGNASGMAPRARIAVYKALYRNLGGFVADVVAAIDQAVRDGVDVLSLSVGPSSPPTSTQTTFLNAFDVALLSAVKAGIFVVQAAGNGGPYAKTMASFSPWIMSVAAGLDDRSYRNSLLLGNGLKLEGAGLSPPTGSEEYSLVLAEDALVSNSSFQFSTTNCQQPEAFNKSAVEGKILVCTYSFSFVFGGSTVKRVSETAQNLSAAGFILAVKMNLPGSKFTPVPIKVPGIVITSLEDSMSLLDYYNTSTNRDALGHVTSFGAKAKIGNGLIAGFDGTAPQVAIYSSRGPDIKNFNFQDADVLKPDILAPGSLIWGAWSSSGMDEPDFEGQSFALMSGTSMATPHIAGIAALLKQRLPFLSPAAIASAMITTAAAVDNKGEALLAQTFSNTGFVMQETATPFDFGGGAVNPTAALDPGLVFDAGYPDYINYICSIAGVDHIRILNATGSSCGLIPTRSVDLNTPSITISNLSMVKKVTRTVTNIAEIETYKASFTPPKGVVMSILPDSFVLPEGNSINFVVTFEPAVIVGAALVDTYSFGEIVLEGDKGHRVRIPVAVKLGRGK